MPSYRPPDPSFITDGDSPRKTAARFAQEPGRRFCVVSLGNRQHLTGVDQVGVGDSAGGGDLVVLVAVAVETLRDRPQRVTRDHRVGARCGRWRWWRRRRGCGGRGRLFDRSRCDLGLQLGRRRRRFVRVGLRGPGRAIGGVQHQIAVVLQDEPGVLLALGVGMPHRLVGGVQHEVAVGLHLGTDDVLSVRVGGPDRLTTCRQDQIAVVLERQGVGTVVGGERTPLHQLLSFGERVSHVDPFFLGVGSPTRPSGRASTIRAY